MSYKKWVLIAVFLFVIGLSFGLAIPDNMTNLLYEELAVLKELSAVLVPFQVTTAILIFAKNVSALLMSFIFSPILCLMPILSLIFNGILLSFISALVVQEESVGLLLAGILPHGIFEIPALILGNAAALSFGATVLLVFFKKRRGELLLPSLKRNSYYLMIALALLLPAAIIETYLTPLLLT